MSRDDRSHSISSRPDSELRSSRRGSMAKRSENSHDFLLECRASYLAVFKELDVDIESRQELAKVLHQAGRNPTSKIINKYWTNKTDVLTFQDFCDICRKEPQINEADLKKAFQKIDVNGDGYVTNAELSKFLMNRGDRMSREEVQDLIDEVDVNRDGRLDYREFIAMTLKTHQECQKLAIKRLEKRLINESSAKQNGSRSATPALKEKDSAVNPEIASCNELNLENSRKEDESTDKREDRQDRREDRREERESRQEDRREERESRQEDRREDRESRQEGRREDRESRQEEREEDRENKLEDKMEKERDKKESESYGLHERQEGRESRQENREEKKESRQEDRQDRRESRQDRRESIQEERESRLEDRQERKESRQEDRQDRRESIQERESRQEDRQERKESRQEDREEGRESRQEGKRNRRESRQDRRESIQGERESRQENRQERRKSRQEDRQEGRESRQESRIEGRESRIKNEISEPQSAIYDEKVSDTQLKAQDRPRSRVTSAASRASTSMSLSSDIIICKKPPKVFKSKATTYDSAPVAEGQIKSTQGISENSDQPKVLKSRNISSRVPTDDETDDDVVIGSAQNIVHEKYLNQQALALKSNLADSDISEDDGISDADSDVVISTARSVKQATYKELAAPVSVPTPTPKPRRVSTDSTSRASRVGRDSNEWARAPITSKMFTVHKPSNLRDWKMVKSKGCFFFNDRDRVVSHQYQLKIGAESAAYITIEPLCVRPGADINSMCEVSGNPMDVMLFVLDADDTLVAFTEQRADAKGKYAIECTLRRGLYKLIAFTTGCRFKPRISQPRDEIEIVRRPKNGKPSLTKNFRDALGDIFDICDLNGNGLMSRDEFNWYSMRTCDQEVEDSEWSVVEEKVDMTDGQITRQGFLTLNEMQADEEDDEEDFWNSLDAMGFNRKLVIDEASPFAIEIYVEKGTAALRVNKLDVGGKTLTNAIVESTIRNGEANRVAGSKDIYIHSFVTNFRGCFVIENQSSSKANIVMDCSKSVNVISHQMNLCCSVEVPPKSAVVAHHLMPVKESQNWTIVCQDSIRS